MTAVFQYFRVALNESCRKSYMLTHFIPQMGKQFNMLSIQSNYCCPPDFIKQELGCGSAEAVHNEIWNTQKRVEPIRNEPKPPTFITKPPYFLKFS